MGVREARSVVAARARERVPAVPSSDGGFTMVEVAFAVGVLAFAMLALLGAFGTNFAAVEQAKATVRATRFLQETMASIDAQQFDDLPVLNGNVFYDNANSAIAVHAVTVNVTATAPNLLQVRAVLSATRTGRELARVVTLRSRR